MKKHLSIGLSAFALAALLSGCGGGSGTTTTPTTAAPATPPPRDRHARRPTSAPSPRPPRTSRWRDPSAGQIVVDGKGMSVYYFTKDIKDSGTSACTGACLTAWPPVLATATPDS